MWLPADRNLAWHGGVVLIVTKSLTSKTAFALLLGYEKINQLSDARPGKGGGGVLNVC